MSGPAETHRVTHLLRRWHDGDAEALDQMAPLVYDELRKLARHHMRRERRGHVLQTTALVHEAFLDLVDLDVQWRDRVHFFAIASRQMRRVLVDLARRRNAQKRGADATMVSLDESLVAGVAQIADSGPGLDVLALDQALDRLTKIDPRKVKVLEMRCFGGLTIDEVSQVLDVSAATVERDLSFARAWLASRLPA